MKQILNHTLKHTFFIFIISLFCMANLFAITPTIKSENTIHEGVKNYNVHWNFWVRVDGQVTNPSDSFFKDYEQIHPAITKLINDIGAGTATAKSEEEVWIKVQKVWNFLSQKVQVNNQDYATLVVNGNWPSLLLHAQYYQTNNKLVWAACFSKAHLFAILLGRVGIPRWRIAIANAHHSENGAPSTATHVYVAFYTGGKWLYLDPTWVYSKPTLPSYESRTSVGNFQSVDYKHPYSVLPIPLSGLNLVPLLN
ncbi:MAG: transglutaminase domain-containing protein [Oligoflexia bacterium]|nr:transglutaminase domain-containing protein [Oligoflexia bacterium]